MKMMIMEMIKEMRIENDNNDDDDDDDDDDDHDDDDDNVKPIYSSVMVMIEMV